ncbi:MAG: hypothetical protein IPM29_15880 [Planctomycetes bacterium]|nr:hypothetical protein [Planctomycetota bacterium]
MKILKLAPALLLVSAGCGVVAEKPRPAVQFIGELRSQWVRRGMPQNANPVLQGRGTVTVPTRWADAEQPDETVSVEAFANMDLGDETGSAWFPDGHGGRVTAFDVTGFYVFQTEAFDLRAGLTNYSLPYGAFFERSGPRGATTEAFTVVGTEALGVRPELQIHYDFDQADGLYLNLNVSEDFQVADDLTLVLLGGLGYSSGNQAWWDYGTGDGGLSDFELRGDLRYRISDNHAVGVNASFTTIVDSGIRDWFDLVGIDQDNLAIGVYGVGTY